MGQEFVEEKSNEITAIPKLLKMLSLEGHLVTIDAMGTQTHIPQAIIDKKTDYLLALKGNQGLFQKEVIDHFDFAFRQVDFKKLERISNSRKKSQSTHNTNYIELELPRLDG